MVTPTTEGHPSGGEWGIATKDTSGPCSRVYSHTWPRMLPLYDCTKVKGSESDAPLPTALLLG